MVNQKLTGYNTENEVILQELQEKSLISVNMKRKLWWEIEILPRKEIFIRKEIFTPSLIFSKFIRNFQIGVSKQCFFSYTVNKFKQLNAIL